MWLYVIGACLFYPLFYDGRQVYNDGFDYLNDKWNYVDIFHITMGYTNLYLQWKLDSHELVCKLTMIFCVFTCLIKQFFFMRIIMSFSYIVTMIVSVVYDLRIFLTFYIILMVSFSMVFNVISSTNEADEYREVGPIMGNLLTTVRLSLGDFTFDIINGKDK